MDIARTLRCLDIIEILESRQRIELDPSLPKLRDWLTALGGLEYFKHFVAAKYEIGAIAAHGLDDDDLDAVGIPKAEERGLRKKLKMLYRLDEFYSKEEEDGDDEEEDDEEEGDEEEEEDED